MSEMKCPNCGCEKFRGYATLRCYISFRGSIEDYEIKSVQGVEDMSCVCFECDKIFCPSEVEVEI